MAEFLRECPTDGKEYDAQCARCGSSLSWEDCWNCGGEGTEIANYGDDDEGDEYEYVDCEECAGFGTHPVCLSGDDWCRAHPIAGRQDVEPSTPEWFEVIRG